MPTRCAPATRPLSVIGTPPTIEPIDRSSPERRICETRRLWYATIACTCTSGRAWKSARLVMPPTPRPSTGPVVGARGIAAVVAGVLKRRLAHLEDADKAERVACVRVEARLAHAQVVQEVGVAALGACGGADHAQEHGHEQGSGVHATGPSASSALRPALPRTRSSCARAQAIAAVSVGEVLPSELGSPGALTCSAYSADCSPYAPYATFLSQAPDWHDQNTIARSPFAAVKSRLVPEGPSRR